MSGASPPRIPPREPRPVDRAFFARDTLEVAHDLIGATLAYGDCSGVVVETEAYKGDPASHFVTRRHKGAIMGTTYGCLYIYTIYGLHRCANITTERDAPGAVLLRALEPVGGTLHMRRRRGTDTVRDLARGPANLFVALGLDPSLFGRVVTEVMTITPAAQPMPVDAGPRVGITRAADLPWRFWLRGSPFVSRVPGGGATRA